MAVADANRLVNVGAARWRVALSITVAALTANLSIIIQPAGMPIADADTDYGDFRVVVASFGVAPANCFGSVGYGASQPFAGANQSKPAIQIGRRQAVGVGSPTGYTVVPLPDGAGMGKPRADDGIPAGRHGGLSIVIIVPA